MWVVGSVVANAFLQVLRVLLTLMKLKKVYCCCGRTAEM